jgi:hypothetical protein
MSWSIVCALSGLAESHCNSVSVPVLPRHCSQHWPSRTQCIRSQGFGHFMITPPPFISSLVIDSESVTRHQRSISTSTSNLLQKRGLSVYLASPTWEDSRMTLLVCSKLGESSCKRVITVLHCIYFLLIYLTCKRKFAAEAPGLYLIFFEPLGE